MSISELDRSSDDHDLGRAAAEHRPAPPADLYDAGRVAVDDLMTFVEGAGVAFERGRALDFGSGIGHTAQALAGHVDQVDGVELSASMVDLASSYNEAGDRCRYHLHRMQHLGLFADDTFDLVFSDGALPHLRPDNQLRFISEFIRVLRPGGVAVFDAATRYARPMRRLRSKVGPRMGAKRRPDVDDVFCLRAAEVRLQVELVGARIVTDREIAATTVDRRQFLAQA